VGVLTRIGTPVKEAVPRLPLGAQKVGSGEAAMGCVCRAGVPSVPWEWLIIGALAAALYLKR
jgi:hypothetical protein